MTPEATRLLDHELIKDKLELWHELARYYVICSIYGALTGYWIGQQITG